jgi:hypothetical protein
LDLNPISANVSASLCLTVCCAKLHCVQIGLTDLKLVMFFVVAVILVWRDSMIAERALGNLMEEIGISRAGNIMLIIEENVGVDLILGLRADI